MFVAKVPIKLNCSDRQFYSKDDLFKRKVDAIKENLDNAKETLDKLDGIIKNTDLVIGAFDNFSARAVLQAFAKKYSKPFIATAVSPIGASINIYNGNNGCYACGMMSANDVDVCTLAPLDVQKIAIAIATELAVKCLLKKDIDYTNITYNQIIGLKRKKMQIKSENCPICGRNGILKKENIKDAINEWLKQTSLL